jgi:hypothetical protein
MRIDTDFFIKDNLDNRGQICFERFGCFIYIEHGLLGCSRIIIQDKNIKEPLIGGCSSSIMICVDIHM